MIYSNRHPLPPWIIGFNAPTCLRIWVGVALLTTISCIESRTTPNKNPLIYNRLRMDPNYLELYRSLQSKYLYDETPIKLNLTNSPSRESVDTYYESKLVDADSISFDDLVLESLDRTYISRYMANYLYNYDNPEDRRKASDPRLVSPTRCATELSYLKRKLDQLSSASSSPVSPELAAFFDSYASEEPGLLFGNYHWTGNWRQCSKRLVFDLDRANASNSISFQGRYCVASIRPDRWEAKIEQRARERVETYFKSEGQQYDYRRFFRVQVGICLPESCDSTTFDDAKLADLIRQLAVRKLNEPLKSYKLVDLFCLPDETSELRQLDSSGRLFVLAALVWCSTIVAATCYDVARPERETKGMDAVDKLVSAMSLKRNYGRLTKLDAITSKSAADVSNAIEKTSKAEFVKQFMSEQTQIRRPTADDLTFLNFFKVFCMPTILLGHMVFVSKQSERFPLSLVDADTSFLIHYCLNAIFLIDWFFVMAAFVTVYSVFASKRVDRIPVAQWAYSIFHRYWRLAPMYIIVFWFCRSVFHSTGQGPIWDYGTTNMTLRGVCRQESWLWPITLTSNWHPFHEECILPSWYISSVMQFYLITPLILVSLAKWPLATWFGTIAAILVSIAMRIHHYMVDPNLDVLSLGYPRVDATTRIMFDSYPTYIYPHYRIPTYLIGLLAGHYCYMVLSGKWRSSFYPSVEDSKEQGQPRARRVVWFTSAILLVALMFSSWYPVLFCPVSLEPIGRPLVSFFYGISHSLDGFVFAMLLVTFMLGQFERLKSLLSHPVWTLLSRLNYSLLLIHCELIYRIHQSGQRVLDWNNTELVREWFLLLCLCYPLAAVITITLELPLANLEREFIGNWLTGRSVRPTSPEISKPISQPKA